ncbi:copper amine oxidase N-terminal domain-containing protein [Paenibacillus oenotherae]|uniref:Copper amine oxidase N-terminal domain-containing protein n=1 Tax=Paenibacillus oenotherae TaxID=1435645 RepID=A0ABS7D6C8_9BACL|nr:copper amine oxidase N-terminal domain-containing protein [Paenibacillus oenotherae]MBW7475107.1 copper amine oxidase N-terminal domain-containing protein [Paenibacillus oenotherae]
MKRSAYVMIGMMIGILISFGIGASGGRLDSLIGKGIQGEREMYLNGEKIGTAVIFDGQTFIPVRSMNGYFGINFTLDSKKIAFGSEPIYAMRPAKYSLYQIKYSRSKQEELLRTTIMEMNKKPSLSLAEKNHIALLRFLLAKYELWETEFLLENS